MFRSQARLLRFRPDNGMQIIARGRVTIYDARGELQLSAEFLEPLGAGALQLAFEQLKARLAEEGLFDPSRRKPIPPLPRRIGLVTSPRGAALHDMLNILARVLLPVYLGDDSYICWSLQLQINDFRAYTALIKLNKELNILRCFIFVGWNKCIGELYDLVGRTAKIAFDYNFIIARRS